MKSTLVSIFLAVIVLISSSSHAQKYAPWKQEIRNIATKYKTVTGVSIYGNAGRDTLTVNGSAHLPMQSVYKFHIALAVLSEVDKGKLDLNQKIKITSKDLWPKTRSPIRDKYPEGTTLTLAQILQYTVSESDNNGCDLLLRLLGGPAFVDNYFRMANFSDISIKATEQEMHSGWDVQFSNWTTPIAATNLLKAFYLNELKLSKNSYNFLLATMKATSTGKQRIKGLLPSGTVVAHKTGTGGSNDTTGLTSAVNDIGIVFLPKGNYFIISVMVTESGESSETNEKIIADISRVAWDYFSGNRE